MSSHKLGGHQLFTLNFSFTIYLTICVTTEQPLTMMLSLKLYTYRKYFLYHCMLMWFILHDSEIKTYLPTYVSYQTVIFGSFGKPSPFRQTLDNSPWNKVQSLPPLYMCLLSRVYIEISYHILVATHRRRYHTESYIPQRKRARTDYECTMLITMHHSYQ